MVNTAYSGSRLNALPQGNRVTEYSERLTRVYKGFLHNKYALLRTIVFCHYDG